MSALFLSQNLIPATLDLFGSLLKVLQKEGKLWTREHEKKHLPRGVFNAYHIYACPILGRDLEADKE